MPRVLIGSIADSRVSISLAALLVNVTASRPEGDTCPVWDQPRNAGDQHACLAGAGTGQDQGVLGGQSNSGELLGIEVVKKILHRQIIKAKPAQAPLIRWRR